LAGIAGKRSVNIGDESSLASSSSPSPRPANLWVTANFRETQIQRMQPGQTATVHVDALSRDYQAKVESSAGATGLALQPAAAGKRQRQLRQGRPAHPGAPAPRQGSAGDGAPAPGMSVEPRVRVR